MKRQEGFGKVFALERNHGIGLDGVKVISVVMIFNLTPQAHDLAHRLQHRARHVHLGPTGAAHRLLSDQIGQAARVIEMAMGEQEAVVGELKGKTLGDIKANIGQMKSDTGRDSSQRNPGEGDVLVGPRKRFRHG